MPAWTSDPELRFYIRKKKKSTAFSRKPQENKVKKKNKPPITSRPKAQGQTRSYKPFLQVSIFFALNCRGAVGSKHPDSNRN
jgi:hypothetical protein